MKLFNKIRQKIKLYYINRDPLIMYKYLEISKNTFLLEYVIKKAHELAEKEGVKIFNVSFDEMNEDEKNDDNKAVGRFISLSKNSNYLQVNNFKHQMIKSNFYKKDYIDRVTTYPRIELSEKADDMVIIHELGHYFLYKRNLPQTEKDANRFIKEFFETYLPPFFKWIFQIDIKIRYGSKEFGYEDGSYEFTNLECYNYLQDYKKFKEEYEQRINDTSIK